MTLDELKQNWERIEVKADSLDESIRDIERKVNANKVSTIRDRVRRSTLRLGFLALVSPVVFVPLWTMSHTLLIAATVFFFIMASLDFILASRLADIDYCTMTTAQALQATIDAERLRQKFKVAGIIMAVPLLLLMGYTFYQTGEPIIMYGCLTGAVTGGIIGLMLNAHFNRLFKAMKKELDLNCEM